MKTNLLVALLAIVAAFCIGACGGGVNHSDPESVAYTAINAMYNGDYATLKTLVDPADEYRLGEMDHAIELAEKGREKYGEPEAVTIERNVKSIVDARTGGDVTDATTSVKVTFDLEKWPRQVILDKKDGKWYFDQFK